MIIRSAISAAILAALLGCEGGGSSPVLASCWTGPNAEARMMNVLSPKMPEDVFSARVSWMRSRGCNAAHVFLSNSGDGEFAGYSIADGSDREEMRRRFRRLESSFSVVVPWLLTDDSPAVARAVFADPAAFVRIASDAGFLGATFVVLGLEMDEYGTAANWTALRDAVRDIAPGLRIATHHAGGEWRYAHLGEIVMDQPPVRTASAIAERVKRAEKMGLEYHAFEIDRHENRELCEAALAAGARGVGNW